MMHTRLITFSRLGLNETKSQARWRVGTASPDTAIGQLATPRSQALRDRRYASPY